MGENCPSTAVLTPKTINTRCDQMRSCNRFSHVCSPVFASRFGSVVVVVVVVVVVRTCSLYDVSVHAIQQYAPNSNGRTPGSRKSRRPRHPFPALMAGVKTGRVPVYTALKGKPVDEQPTSPLTSQHEHRTSTTVDELLQVIDHTAPVVAYNKHATTSPEYNESNWESSAVFSTSAQENCTTCTNEVEHLINVLQLENLCGKRTATVGSRLSPTTANELLGLHNKHQSPCQCTATREELWSAEQQDHGNRPLHHDRK